MDTGFRDPIETMKGGKKIKNPWNFDQPVYDMRSSCYVNAGTYHGVGINQPVGTEKQTKGYAVPAGKVQTLSLKPNYETTEIY
jgi:hypothetical protein